MQIKFSVLTILLFLFLIAKTQNRIAIIVKDSVSEDILPGVSVILHPQKASGSTDAEGKIIFQNIQKGVQEIKFSYVGYQTKKVSINILSDTSLTIFLNPVHLEIEEITVTATRTNARMEDTPLKVEVLGTEEVNEENTIKPGNLTSLIGDISGIQIQQSSAVSANANVRIQGLDGKYTQILRDGMPLFDGFSGSFSILQIPPLDIRQIEMIKGSASTLYGGGAIGGIINLVSKEPSEKNEGLITLNQSTLTERNFNGYLSVKKKKRGATIFSAATYQNPVDVDKDGFSDVPKIQNLVIHPRLFFYLKPGTTLSLGFTSTYETRRGGDMQALNNNSDSLHSFFQEDQSDRNTGDFVFRHITAQKNIFTAKGMASFFDRRTFTNKYRFDATQVNSYNEISYLIPREKNDFVSGININGTGFEINDSDSALLNDFNNHTAGIFAQNTFKPNEKLFLEAGMRIDYHSRYNLFFLPRMAVLHKINEHWYSRAGVGWGYLNPNPFAAGNTEQNPTKILPVADSVESEKSAGANLEINYKTRVREKIFIYLNHAFFYTQVNHPIVTSADSLGVISFLNKDKPLTSAGWDTYLRMNVEELEIYFGYTYTMAKQTYNSSQPYIAYTPRNRAATVIIYEIENRWRFGLEGSYNSFQYRDDGTRTPYYFITAAMIEKKFKYASVVLNGENLLDVQQSSYEKIILPPNTFPVFMPLWAPIDGRAINLSLVLRF